MDATGFMCALVLATAAVYRHIVKAPPGFTIGLWVTSASQLISALVTVLDPPLLKWTGLANLSQIITYTMMVASSYTFAHLTYRYAGLGLKAPRAVTIASLLGMTTVYFTTNLSTEPALVVEKITGPASYAFSWLLAIGLLPTHLGAMRAATQGDTAPVYRWLFGLYGISGSIYPTLMILDRTDPNTPRWPVEITYPIVWTVQLASYIALTAAGFVGANRAGRHRDEALEFNT